MALRWRERQREKAEHESSNVGDTTAAIRERIGAAAVEVLALVRDAEGGGAALALPALVNQRLAAAAEHICQLVHAAVTRYEERIRRQERLLDLVYQPQTKLCRTELAGVTHGDHQGDPSVSLPAGDPVALETAPSLGQHEEEEEEASVVLATQEEDDVVEEREAEEVEKEAEEEQDVEMEEDDDEWRPGRPICRDRRSSSASSRTRGGPCNYATAVRGPQQAEPAHRCKVCREAFRRVNPFLEHAQTHLEDPGSGCCPFCGAWCPSGEDLRAHFKTHVSSSHICDVCGKGFSSRCALKLHRVVHTGERPFTCDVCGKTFKQQGGLSLHRVVHTGERPFACDMCGKTFRQKINLDTHIRFHNKERPYLCQVCGKSFVQSVDLKRHMLTHTGEQPYGCRQCGRRFQARRCLNLHMKKHQQERPPDVDENASRHNEDFTQL